MSEDMKYKKVYEQLQKDRQEYRQKQMECLKQTEELEKKIEMVDELIQPFEKHFGPDDPASASIIETQLGI